MRLKLYCNRYAHFKDPLVCSINCVYRTRCRDFALFYDAHRDEVDKLVADYLEARRESPLQTGSTRLLPLAPTVVDTNSLLKLEVKREMPEATFIWIGKDDRAELLELAEVIRRAESGSKAKHIYRVSQEMELRYQLVPRQRIDKAKRAAAADAAVKAERAAARGNSRLRPVAAEPTTTPPSVAPAPQPAITAAAVAEQPPTASPRRTRSRKVSGGR